MAPLVEATFSRGANRQATSVDKDKHSPNEAEKVDPIVFAANLHHAWQNIQSADKKSARQDAPTVGWRFHRKVFCDYEAVPRVTYNGGSVWVMKNHVSAQAGSCEYVI